MGAQSKRVDRPVGGAVHWPADNVSVLRGGGQSDWWHASAVQALDFVNARASQGLSDVSLSSCVTTTRDSAAWMADDAGNMQSFAANDMARIAGIGADVEGRFINKTRNPRGEGGTVGVIGSGGSLPTNWSVALAMSGCATSFVGSGVVNGLPYTDIRIAGTLSGASPFILAMDVQDNAAAVPGQAWGVDCGLKLQAGTLNGLATALVRVIDTPGFFTVAETSAVSLSGGALTKYSAKGIVFTAGTTAVHPRLYVNSLNNGAVVDATIRIYAPKLVQLSGFDGPDLVTNGDFSNVTDWTQGTGWTIAAGVATKAAGTASNLSRPSSAVFKSVYKMVYTLSGVSAGTITPRLGSVSGTVRSTNGTFTDYIAAGAFNPDVLFIADGSFVGTLDDVSLKLVTPGYMPLSPILPPVGAPADSTRLADALSCASFEWFAAAGLNSGASELVIARLSHTGDQASRCLFEYSDGTTANYIRGVVNAADRVELSIKTGGVLQGTATLISPVSAAKQAFGFGWSADGGYVTNGSETASFGAVTLPALTQKRIGNGLSAFALNDVLRQVQACALLTSAEAANWAASA